MRREQVQFRESVQSQLTPEQQLAWREKMKAEQSDRREIRRTQREHQSSQARERKENRVTQKQGDCAVRECPEGGPKQTRESTQKGRGRK